MKYISQYSDRLEQAFKRIDELEKENNQLRAENVALRGAKSRRSTTNFSIKSPSTQSSHTYAQPTVSSQNKSKMQPPVPGKDEERKPCNCTPILVYDTNAPKLNRQPGYMNRTNSSCRRESACWAERYMRKKEAEERLARRSRGKTPQHDSTYDSEWDSPSYETKLDHERVSMVDEPYPTDLEIEKKTEGDLAQRSRLEERHGLSDLTVQLDSKKSLDYLCRAAEIVQQSIFDATQNGMGAWRDFDDDGPHLVRLGRDELKRWMGKYPYCELAYNGYSASEIHYVVFNVVGVRNAISHPEGDWLRDLDVVYGLLQRAQRASLVLGNEEGTMEIREMRDAVCSDAMKDIEYLQGLYHLALQPCQEDFDLQPRHRWLLRIVNGTWNRMSDEEKEKNAQLFVVAQAWSVQYRK
ncbi:hypothetical protein F5Y03DRAFT_405061 [Xylaria venustula]|nr:hypothetical protein F5Y03DRAFT_405061 [Xylaria venustula]